MRLSIRQNGDERINYNQVTINGWRAAGLYGFTIVLKGTSSACPVPVLISSIRINLTLADPSLPLLKSLPASSPLVKCQNYHNDNQQLAFEFCLTKEQINALEEHRKFGDLVLKFDLSAIVSSKEEAFETYDIETATIPREKWLSALNQSGFRQTLLFEVPVPFEVDRLDLNTLYAKAQEFIEIGHYKDAVMQCRHIIEHAEKARNDSKHSKEANRKAQDRTTRQEMSANERMLSLREQIKNICQLGAHGSESFTRSQSKTVLGITMALLAEPTVGFFNDEPKQR
ncbi:hypothetical protein [Enterovibrio norvegicus]|uniref:hypothetical protein n=1 Tax=Enterovibrio norvegicus TaxID=188144 RepID=UPI000C85EDDE|nr:hypothetical protein [Enterovibrio norvegicus]PMN69389.1 hypothetical protein BCT27_20715 [Enterovibrio norvegicus]